MFSEALNCGYIKCLVTETVYNHVYADLPCNKLSELKPHL